jgi:hypothetical protein
VSGARFCWSSKRTIAVSETSTRGDEAMAGQDDDAPAAAGSLVGDPG